MKTWMIVVPFTCFFAMFAYGAFAAPNGVVKIGQFWSGSVADTVEVHRFQDKGPKATVDCYVAYVSNPGDSRVHMQCFRTETP